ncbi:glycosyltransferase family 39 protein [Agromyces subbeticus]|uniref:glycosyltransferase family 39 protein n=1 Tax=Agromyces subbeticus TaxID=293890 RepID=UPI00146F5B6E|nr:glycosyltransferase family 39 protein [Agromyces subbeticus]
MVRSEHAARVDSAITSGSTANWRDGRVAVVIGAATTLVAVAGSWIPSIWGDEAASLMSARRDWASLWTMLGTVDAVHGFYYALLHVWIDLVGDSPLAIRLPSGMAVGAASAGLYLLVRRRAPRETAMIAAVVFAVLPRVTFLATEARSLAFSTAAVVWLTLLALRLLDAPMRRVWWWVYAIGLALSSYLFLYSALLIPVHAIVVAVELRRTGPARGIRLRPFLVAWATAAVLAAPIAVIAVMQRDQIAFSRASREVSPEAVLIQQWFMFEPAALVAWALIAVAVAAVTVRAAPHRRPPAHGHRHLLVLGIVWAVVPTAVLLVVAAVASLGYTPRYLAFCAPAVAILIAIAVAALPRRWMRVVAVAVIAVLALPAYLDQRSPYWKNGGTDWQAVAEVVDEVAEPGDGIVFDEGVRPSRRPRLAMHAYTHGFEGLVDLALVRPYDATDHLWDVTAPLSELEERLDGVDRVVVVSRGDGGVEHDVATLRRAGFAPVERVDLVSTVITVHERRS